MAKRATKKKAARTNTQIVKLGSGTRSAYDEVLRGVVGLLEAARRTSVRAVNTVMTATYWEIGRRIVQTEQKGAASAKYGEQLITKLSSDLTNRFGRGFAKSNLYQMRAFYVAFSTPTFQTPSGESTNNPIFQTVSGISGRKKASAGALLQSRRPDSRNHLLAARFPLPWSHYVRLLGVENDYARKFYEDEALRGGWSVRQLDRQIGSQFYERTALSKNKIAVIEKGRVKKAGDTMSAEEEIKDPLVLEFLGLKDEYSEAQLEEAIIHRLEEFLLELGSDFAFIGRQKRLRVGDQWFRVDLLLFHRRLRCLVIIDLKLTPFSPADVGQMNFYLNYAKHHWTNEGENPPVGLILSASTNAPVATYALSGLENKVLAAKYRTSLPSESVLRREIEKATDAVARRKARGG